MEEANRAYLIVKKADGYQADEVVPLPVGKVLLGRETEGHQPDVSFSGKGISRRHATIDYEDGVYTLTDISANGVNVNGSRLAKGVPYDLRNGDHISLADGEAALEFRAVPEPDGTIIRSEPGTKVDLCVDERRREVRLDGRSLKVSGKLFDLLACLYRQRGHVVNHAQIKTAIWPERPKDAKGVPEVSQQEIDSVVHRLRDQLGPYGHLVKTRRGYGYMLDLIQ